MSEALQKASRDAVDAADNAELVRTIAAVLAAQQLSQPVAPAPAPVQRPYGAYIALGLGGVVGVTFLAMAAAMLAAAVAVGLVCATAALIVLKSMFTDYQKGNH